MTPECSVIIPTFNAAALLARCLEALSSHPPTVAHEVIVVDDGSRDESFRVLAERGDDVHIVHNPENAGFAVACNAGAEAARGRLLVFLNNDTRPRAGWLDALAGYAASHPEAAAVGSKLLYPDGTVQHAGVVFCQDGYPRHLYAGFPGDHPAVTRARRLQAVTAACMLVRRETFEPLGGFDAGYRNGFEDVDLCLRLVEAGHEVHYCPDSVVEHLESVSEGRFRHDRDNVRRYRDRWSHRVRRDDVEHYLADGLIRFAYEAAYPYVLEVAPELAVIDAGSRVADLEAALASRSRQVSALLRETVRLLVRVAQLELNLPPGADPARARADDPRAAGAGGSDGLTAEGDGRTAEDPDPDSELLRDEAFESRLLALEEAIAALTPGGSNELAGFEASEGLRHREGVRRSRRLAGSRVPRGAALLVVSHGDPELVAVAGVRAAHFPQTRDGMYAGYHPESCATAIAELEALRERGAGEYLLIPDGTRWWLERYPDFHGHLERRYRRIADDKAGVIYELMENDRASDGAGAAPTRRRRGEREPSPAAGHRLEWGSR